MLLKYSWSTKFVFIWIFPWALLSWVTLIHSALVLQTIRPWQLNLIFSIKLDSLQFKMDILVCAMNMGMKSILCFPCLLTHVPSFFFDLCYCSCSADNEPRLPPPIACVVDQTGKFVGRKCISLVLPRIWVSKPFSVSCFSLRVCLLSSLIFVTALVLQTMSQGYLDQVHIFLTKRVSL